MGVPRNAIAMELPKVAPYYIIGFNHGMLCLVLTIARGPCFWSQNNEAEGRGVLTEETRTEGYIQNQAQHAMIKTYYSTNHVN